MADTKMNQFSTAKDANYIYAEASNGSQVKISKSDLMNLISTIFPQLNKLNYSLGGINHVMGDSELINADGWIYASGFKDGDIVTISVELDAGTSFTIFSDNGYTVVRTLQTDETRRLSATVTKKGNENMLFRNPNGPVRKVMAELGYFASEWRPSE